MSPARRVRRRVEAPADGARLDDFLAGWLPAELERPLSRSSVRRLVLSGSVSVDGRVSRRPAFELRAGSRVEAAVDLSRLPEGRQASAGRDAPRVLFEDDWLLAIDKPSGVPFHAGADAGRPDFVGYVRAWLASRTPSAEPPYLGVHQRLDRDTSGVVVFARAPQANAGLAEQFEQRQVEKTYLAVVARPPRLPPRAWSADAPLGRVGRGRQGPVAPDQGGRDARTELRLLDVGPRALLVEARPLTGRQHQIRVHLALAGLPILGDRVYGPGGAAARLLLHAARLALRHPRDGRALVIECPPPPEFAAALAAAGPARTRRG